MKRIRGPRTDAAELRRRAEARLSKRSLGPTPMDADIAAQLHELQVHQLELEMQNHELQRSGIELEAALARYTTLYDFAPTSYFTLDRNSAIADGNLAGASLLGLARSQLSGRRFLDFVDAAARPAFSRYLAQVFEGAPGDAVEMALRSADGRPLFVQLKATADVSAANCRMSAADITSLREAEQRAQELLRQNRLLARRMFHVQEEERRHLARELHDELGQWLTAIQADTEAIRIGFAADPSTPLHAGIQAIGNNAAEIHRVIRRILSRLRPSVLDSLGLPDSLRELVVQWCGRHPRIHCDLEIDSDVGPLLGPANESLNITLYRIVQEALTNVARHAAATRVAVKLRRANPFPEAPVLVLTIEDNGKGMIRTRLPGEQAVAANAKSGLGLMGMRERIIAADGEFRVRTSPGQGFSIEARLPVANPVGQEQPA